MVCDVHKFYAVWGVSLHVVGGWCDDMWFMSVVLCTKRHPAQTTTRSPEYYPVNAEGVIRRQTMCIHLTGCEHASWGMNMCRDGGVDNAAMDADEANPVGVLEVSI